MRTLGSNNNIRFAALIGLDWSDGKHDVCLQGANLAKRAELALELLAKYPERLQPLNPQSAEMRAIEQLVEMRRRLIDDQTRITNRLTMALKNYYP